LGGFVSLLIAIENESNIEKIVIVDSVPFFAALQNPFATEEQMKEMAPNFKISEMSSPEYKNRQYQILKSMIRDSSKIELAMKWSLNSDLDAINQSMYDLYTTDLRDDISGLSTPTLIFGSWIAYKDYGVTKEMVENNFRSQFKGLTNFTLLMSEKGRHFIMWDDQQWFIEQMSNFFEDKS
jgi:pimeloyl-ACP methyl ester carboxylesterase